CCRFMKAPIGRRPRRLSGATARTCVSTLMDMPRRRHPSAALLVPAVLAAAGLAALLLYRVITPEPGTFWRGAGTKIHDLKRLRKGNQVALEGVVTFSDPLEHRFYFQDDTGAMRVQRRVDEPVPRPGTRVFVTGKLQDEFVPAAGIKSIALSELKVTNGGRVDLPVAE